MNYGFGVDLGGTTVKIALFDEIGTMLAKWEIPTVTENGGHRILPDIAASILQFVDQKAIPRGVAAKLIGNVAAFVAAMQLLQQSEARAIRKTDASRVFRSVHQHCHSLTVRHQLGQAKRDFLGQSSTDRDQRDSLLPTKTTDRHRQLPHRFGRKQRARSVSRVDQC